MKFHLMRKPSGSLIVTRNLGAQYEEVHNNFNAAVRLFGKLCKPGEAINGAEWERRILERQPIGKVGPYVDAIRACMLSEGRKPKVSNPPFGWAFMKAIVKDFFNPEQEKPLNE